MESSELPTNSLNLQVPDAVANQIKDLVGFTYLAPSVLQEHEFKREIPIAEGYLSRLVRTVRRQQAPSINEYRYTKSVGALVTSEGSPNRQYAELKASWVDDRCQWLSVMGVEDGQVLNIRFDSSGQIEKAFLELADGSEKVLSAEELAQQTAKLVNLEPDPGQVNSALNKKSEEELALLGGEIKGITPDVNPDLPKIFIDEHGQTLTSPGVASGEGAMMLRRDFLVKRPDGQEVVVVATRVVGKDSTSRSIDSRYAVAAALSSNTLSNKAA